MDARFEEQLIQALDALDEGRSVEEVLARFPAEQAALRPILEHTLQLPALRWDPGPAAQAASRRAFLRQAGSLRSVPAAASRRWPAMPRRPALALTSLAVAAALLVIGTSAASHAALPGDPLYPVKRHLEAARLDLARTDAGRQAVAERISQERLSEVRVLLATGRQAEVEFSGVFEEVFADGWRVSGVLCEADRHTQVAGTPEQGEGAHVIGRTADGHLLVNSIICLAPGESWPPPASPVTPSSPAP
jgi:hypothetical protein